MKIKKTPGPRLQIPLKDEETVRRFKLPRKTETTSFYTFLDGKKRIFCDYDGAEEGSRILDPCKVSLVNVFVNAVLQPPQNYKISRGEFIFLTSELPIKGVPIILQFIKMY